MKILLKDIVQSSTFSVASCEPVKTYALNDVWYTPGAFISPVITFSASSYCDCFGIGNTDATSITLTFGAVTETYTLTNITELVYLKATQVGNQTAVTITHNGTYVGRFAIGRYRSLPIHPLRSPGFYNSLNNRKTVGGQVVMSSGGITSRTIEVDIKCKIDSSVLQDYEDLKNLIPAKMPFFIDFTDDSNFLNFTFLYAWDQNDTVFQSGINSILYSKKFNFEECF